MTDPHRGEYVLVHEEEIENSIWKKSGRNMDRRFPKTLRDHALAISDVIEFADGDASRFFYIDAAGYEEIQF